MGERGRVAGLDGLRGVAIVGVVVLHAHQAWLPGGYLGVDAFFMLSGFLITRLLVAERDATGSIDLRAFWTRRAARIVPAFLVVAAAVNVGISLGRVPWTVEWTWWSLLDEEAFYLWFPPFLALLLAVRRRPLLVVLPLAAASAAWRVWLQVHGATTARTVMPDAQMDVLLIGAALALARPSVSRWWGWLGLAGLAGLFFSPLPLPPAASSSAFVWGAGACAGLVVLSPPRVLELRALAWLGTISYGLFLMNGPMQYLLIPATQWGLPGRLMATWSVLLVGLAAASWYGFERPIVRAARRVTHQRRSRAAASSLEGSVEPSVA